MQRLARFQPIVLIGLLGLLAACGSSAPPPLSTLSGEWIDLEARATGCGETDSAPLGLTLELADNEFVFGEMFLETPEDLFLGPFEGRVTPKGEITGLVDLYDIWSYDAFSFMAELRFTHSGIEGTLTQTDAVRCENGSFSRLSVEVNLQRSEPAAPPEPVEDDALEPNDSNDEAAEINLDYQANLVLKNDDWFTFTLSEEQIVTLDIQPKDTNVFYIGAKIYNETMRVVSDFDFHYSDSKPKIQLSAGTYYLNLFGEVDSETRAYTLKLSSDALPDAALEPNNSAQSASNLPFGTAQTMYLGEEDEDWFTFSLDTAQRVTFDLKNNGDNFYYPVLDSELKQRNNGYSNQPLTVALAAGRYYLKVHNRYITSEYSVRITSEDLPDSALEPNDSAETAAVITPDTSGNYTGDMYLTSGDEDWFTLILSETRLVTFDLGDTYSGFSKTLYNADLEEHQSDRDRGYMGDARSRVLEAGTYYLRVYGYDYEGLAYSLRVSSKRVPDAEYEPNNRFDTAASIQLPFATNLYITQGDADWFSFTLPEKRLVTLERRDTERNYILSGAFHAEDGTELAMRRYLLEVGKNNSFVMPRGNYAISLSGEPFHLEEEFAYFLSIASKEIPLAYEPNDVLEEAYAVPLGFSASNLLVSDDEEDWFSFTLDSESEVNIILKKESGGSLGSYLRSADESYERNILSGSNLLTLSAGTYYLRTYARYNQARGYGISILKQ